MSQNLQSPVQNRVQEVQQVSLRFYSDRRQEVTVIRQIYRNKGRDDDIITHEESRDELCLFHEPKIKPAAETET